MRHYRDRASNFDVVIEIQGHSLFIGDKHALSMDVRGVPRLKQDSVYWIKDGEESVVFDMESEKSTLIPVRNIGTGTLEGTICWHFLDNRS
jgi:hypothetical protein